MERRYGDGGEEIDQVPVRIAEVDRPVAPVESRRLQDELDRRIHRGAQSSVFRIDIVDLEFEHHASAFRPLDSISTGDLLIFLDRPQREDPWFRWKFPIARTTARFELQYGPVEPVHAVDVWR